MKKDIQFARDSSKTLPRVSPIFKIQVTGSDKKRRDKTAVEFGEAMKVYLVKREDRIQLDYSAFTGDQIVLVCSAFNVVIIFL